MSGKCDRLMKLEELASGHQIERTIEQVRVTEKANHCYKKRHIESTRPGELHSQPARRSGGIRSMLVI